MYRFGASMAVFLLCVDACFAGTPPRIGRQNLSAIPQIIAQPQKQEPPKQEMRPGQIVVKLKPGATLDDLRALHRRYRLLDSRAAIKDTPVPAEALARLRQRLSELQPEHQSWYWQLDPNSKEYQVYLDRLNQERAGLEERIRKQEDFIARLEERQKRAPQGLGPAPGLNNIYLLQFPASADAAALAKAYAADEHVEYAEPNYIVRANWVPNDPYFSTAGSWQQAYDDLWGLKRISASAAWEVTKGKGVIVAVVDSGVDYTHEDIAANIWRNPLEIPANGIDDDGNGYIDDDKGWDFIAGVDTKGEKFTEDNDPQDELGHGTHVAGTIAAAGNNNIGIIGVAPEAVIMPVKGLNADGSGDDLTTGNSLKYAVDLGADVINNSWSGNAVSAFIEDLTAYALAQGAVMVAAAGNDNADAGTAMPAYIPGVITVAATDHYDQKSFFSNWGYRVDVAAPGGSLDWEISEAVQASAGAYGFCNGALKPRIIFQVYTSFTPEENRRDPVKILLTKGPAGGVVLYDIHTKDANSDSLILREGGLVLGDTYSPAIEYQAPYQVALKYENPVFVFYLQEEAAAKSLTLDAVQYAGLAWEEPYFLGGLINEQRTGEDILSLAASKARIGLPMADAKYSRMMGTSMACPHVAGTAALVLAAHPEFGVEDVRQAILASSDDIGVPGFDMYYGYGRVNAAKAVRMGSVCASKIGQPRFFDYLKGSAEIRGTAAGKNFQRYLLRCRPWSFYPRELGSGQWQEIFSSEAPVDGGVLGVWDTTRITGGAMYQLELVVEDTLGNSFRADSVVFVDQRLKAGWPYAGAFFMAPPIAADVDNDGYQEVLAKHYDARSGRILLSIFRHDGSKLNGWPEDIRQWGATDLLYPPVACDLDNDRDLEIILAFFRQEDNQLYLYAFHHDGSIVQGWPALIHLNIKDNQMQFNLLLAAADVNNDGYIEVTAVIDDQLTDTGHFYLFGRSGKLLSGWPVVQPLPQHPPDEALNANGCLALGDVSGDDAAEIVIGLRNRVYVYAVNGSLLNGAAITIGDWVNDFHRNINVRNLLLADLDQDGKAEIVLQMGWWKKIYAFRADAAAMPGFPVDGPLSWDMALADIDNDGYPEIIADNAFSGDTPVFAWRHDGSPLAGWPPVMPDSQGSNGISVADLDHNGIKEVILHSRHGRVTAIEPDGSQLLLNLPEYVPTPAYAFSASTPANPAVITDLDGDGKTELITKIDSVNEYLYQGRLYAWELNTGYSPADWPMYGHDAQATRNASGAARPVLQSDLSADGAVTAYDAGLALQEGKTALEAGQIAQQAVN